MRTNISTSISDIDPVAWDALAAGGSPFLRHAFLATLERTGCVGADSGWYPAPITLYDDKGLAAATPAYVKAHSFGEFVFDFSWANAYSSHGLADYPKLVLGVPFTPVSGERLLVRPDLDAAKTRASLIDAIRDFAETRNLSSVHGLFVSAADRQAFEDGRRMGLPADRLSNQLSPPGKRAAQDPRLDRQASRPRNRRAWRDRGNRR
jgi:predicted N-acyltransferase